MKQKLLNGIVLMAFAVSMFIALPRGAFACSCMMPPDSVTAMGTSDVVFAGQVASIVDRSIGQMQSSMDPMLVTFQVNTVWKGDPKPSLSITTSRDSASCGYKFEPGREYIVYANVFEGQLSTNICTRTALLADAQADVAALGEGQTVEQPTAQSPSLMPLILGGLAVAAVIALVAFGAGLFMVRRRQE